MNFSQSSQTKETQPLKLSPAQLADEATFARQVLDAEANAVGGIVLNDAFHKAVDLIVERCSREKQGSLVVSGVGKSGLIGQKLTATFASTGTPSHFLHSTEAMHGDLGRIHRHDVVLALSFGGQTEETIALALILKQDQVPVIALTGNANSDLAKLSSIALCVGDLAEACPHNLAPTASTTAMLALGDALALTLMRRRNFDANDFHKFHPGGMLGRELTPVVQAMRFQAHVNMPLIQKTSSISQAYSDSEAQAPGGRRAGALLIVNPDETLAGIFTDGDLRRCFIKHGSQAWSHPIADYMTTNPRRLQSNAPVRDAVRMVRQYRIDEIPIVDADGKALGLIDVQDLVALKVIAN